MKLKWNQTNVSYPFIRIMRVSLTITECKKLGHATEFQLNVPDKSAQYEAFELELESEMEMVEE